MKKYLLIFLSAFCLACASPHVKRECDPVEDSKYSSHKEVGELLKAQSEGLSSENIYLIFSADYCSACQKLYQILKKEGLNKKVIFIDIEKTWGFLFSREMNISSVPALAVITNNKTIQVHIGLKEVYFNLKKRMNSGKNIKLIQRNG